MIFIFEIVIWIKAIKGFKSDYEYFTYRNDKKFNRILDTFTVNIGLSILIVIHLLIICICSFLYWLFCLGVIK